MGQLGKNSQRVKNILEGNITAKTKVQSGYTKKRKKYKEGDVWEEDGKIWTIKDGIKQNVTKMDEIREMIKIPFTCPECGNVMKNRNDKKFYRLRRMCMNCVIEEDTQRIINGEFEQYEKEITSKNAISWLDEVENKINDYIESRDDSKFVTENGQIEDWQKGYTKEKLKEIFSKQIDEFKEHLNTYIHNEEVKTGDENEER